MVLGNMDVGLNTQNLVAIVVVVALSVINIFGIKTGAIIQNIFTISKVSALFGLALLGLAIGRNAQALAANFHENFWHNAGLGAQHAVQVVVGGPTVLVGTLTILAVAQVGSLFSADAWNNVTFTAGEVKDPHRNLPLSLAMGTGVVIALYIACNFIYLNVLPLDGIANGATILERGIKFASEDRVGTAVMTQMFGAAGGALMAFAILLSSFGCDNGLILSGARVYYAMAKDGLFFRSVSKLHPTYKTPAVSLMVQMVWTCILCLSGTYGQLLDYIIFAVLVFYILTIVGLFILRRTHPNAERPYRAIGYPVLPAVYIVMALFIDVVLLRYKPQYTWPGLGIVLLGIPVYFLWSRRPGMTAGGSA
jgi:APA family basic amino acid/polyamine antiporter